MRRSKLAKVIIILTLLTMLISQSSIWETVGLSGISGSITASAKVSAKKITLDKKTLSMTVGESQTLKTTITPSNTSDKKIQWYSSNKKVAVVSSRGKVTAVDAGRAIITAKTNGRKSACRVIVKRPYDDISTIMLNRSSVTIDIDDILTLTATITPSNVTDGELSWSSDHEDIVYVDDDGTILPINVGTATITVKAKNGKKASCIVTVTDTKSIESKITLNMESISLNVGEKISLSAVIEPYNAIDKTISWASSNTLVATVDNCGNVKAISNGYIVITATLANGKSDSCIVMVANNNVASTEIKLNTGSISLYVGEKAYLYAEIVPYNATDKTVKWASHNTNIATVESNGTITAKAKGTAIITASTNNGKSAACVVTVTDIAKRITFGAGTYIITLKGTRVSLDVNGSSNVNGTNVQVYDSNKSNAQIWSFENHTDGTTSLIAKCATDKMLDVVRTNNTATGALQAGCNVDIYSHKDDLAQNFYLEQFIDGSYVIRLNSNPNLVLQAKGTSSGANVEIGNYDENNALQRWNISSTSVIAADQRRTAYVYNTYGLGVNILNQKTFFGSIIGSFAEGQEITVIGNVQDSWYHVEGTSRDTGIMVNGYVYEGYITFNKATLTATYIWPVPGEKSISSYYGNGHDGIDIASNKVDTIVIAARSGVVVECTPNACYHVSKSETICNGGKGNYIKIKHEDGTYATYTHLAPNTFFVNVGTSVKQGDYIAIMGSSGNSSIQNLHFQLNNSDNSMINVNPYYLQYGNY